jgi:hypothetical protein
MRPSSSDHGFVLKRHGRVNSGQYRLYGLRHDSPLLFIEEVIGEYPEPSVTHVYEDEGHTREALTITDSESGGAEVDLDDAETGERVGRVAWAIDAQGDYIDGTWLITDAEGKQIGKVVESKAAAAALATVAGQRPQAFDVTIGGTFVGSLRQRVNIIGYELSFDFSADAAHLLDRRMGLAVAVFAALQQVRTA